MKQIGVKGIFFRAWDWLAPPAILFCMVILCWHAVTVAFKVPKYLVPSPLSVAQTMYERGGDLSHALRLTGTAALLGFLCSLIVGFVVALAFSQSALIRRSCYPYAIFLQTVPIVAIAPLIITWFGYGFHSVVIVSFMISLFPIITNTSTGLITVDARFLELFAIYHSSRWQVLWKLRVPNCVPFLIAGAKTSSGLSVIGAIVGEFFVGVSSDWRGLGHYISDASGNMNTTLLFAAVLNCTLLGLSVFVLVNVLGYVVLRRWNNPGRGT
ncbi:MAG: binding-protein-dependent transport system inner rane component [Planctomycetaceae bacterium]|nr:binding-protein-dependent transport system inner rane component [Planctomycetaceae bacterium]